MALHIPDVIGNGMALLQNAMAWIRSDMNRSGMALQCFDGNGQKCFDLNCNDLAQKCSDLQWHCQARNVLQRNGLAAMWNAMALN